MPLKTSMSSGSVQTVVATICRVTGGLASLAKEERERTAQRTAKDARQAHTSACPLVRRG